ncbi:hypothetical protein NDU88_002061 [Pleurodeles waltl]|uniref:Uncharacterized protein n=1 Tax=Pleurodeles waltl TaxID=8319 RepID=A0AAV7SAJ4_PLEWA|nr:hypothetical protein NDU88_002061 [Pleurodeles waltl]
MGHQWYLGNISTSVLMEYISWKSTSLAFVFNSVKKATGSSTYLPLLKVIQAKLIPTITYGSETLRSRGDDHLDQMITKLFKRLFSLPNYDSPAQVHLQLGLVRQSVARKEEISILSHELAKEGSLSSLIWVEMTPDPTSAFRLHLESSFTTLGLEDQLLQLSSHQLVKHATKVSVKSLSHLQDKEALSKRTHALFVLSSYGSLLPQLYLGAAINPRIKVAFMKYQMGCLPIYAHLLRWTRVNITDTC